MELYILMTSVLLALIFPTNCIILSPPGACATTHGEPCSCNGGQILSYGGRMALIESGDVGFSDPSPPWANQRVFVFRMPPSFFKKRHHHSIFAHKGIISIVTDQAPCDGHTPLQNDCPLRTIQASGSFCLDPNLPCYKTPPSYAQPEPLTTSDTTPTSITVTWPTWDEERDFGSGPVVSFEIEMRRLNEPDFTKILKGPTQRSHQFNNLEENTDYEFRVTVIRDHPCGEGQPSNPQRFTTSARGPPQYKNSEPLVLEDKTSSSLTISWPEWDASVDDGTGPVTGYKIIYRQQGNGKWRSKVVYSLSITLTPLRAHTTYEVAIRLQYENEKYSPKTSTQTYTTNCPDIDDIDLRLSSFSRMKGRATIFAEWTFSVTESCSVVAQSLTIQQLDRDGCLTLSPVETIVEVSLDVVNRNYTKKRLEAYSEYNVTIALTTATNAIFYKSAQIRTDSSEPSGRPQNIGISKTNLRRGWVALNWDEPRCGTRHGEILEYEFVFRRDNGRSDITGTVGFAKRRFSSLTNGEGYSVEVAAVTAKGSGPPAVFGSTFGQG